MGKNINFKASSKINILFGYIVLSLLVPNNFKTFQTKLKAPLIISYGSQAVM